MNQVVAAEVGAAARTVLVGAADNGQMVSLRVGDRLAIDVPSQPGVQWRLRGGLPLLSPCTPRAGEPAFVLTATRPGRIGVDLVAVGEASLLPRPIRLVACVA